MIKPLVSVIIPVYNVEKYLYDCVDSVVNQTYKNIEIILVDDGSTDGSSAICDKYALKHPNINVIHKQNGGLSDARNEGIKYAKGKYIYFLDSDDLIKKEAIQLLINESEQYNSDIVFFDATVVDENGNPLKDDRYLRKQTYITPTDSKNILRQLFENKDYFPCATMVFIKRDFLNPLIFQKGILYEDILFTFQLFLNAETAVHLPMPLYIRRIRESSITQEDMKAKNIFSLCIIIEKLLDLYKTEQNSMKHNLIYIQINILYGTLINCYCYLNRKEKIKCRKEFLQTLNNLEKTGFKKKRLYEYTKHFSFRFFNKSSVSLLVSAFRNFNINKSYEKYFSKLKTRKQKRNIFVLGTPLHGNLGDHLIAAAERQFFGEFLSEYAFVDIPMPVFARCKNKLKHLVSKDDIVVISGGGWLGSLWLHNENYVRDMVKTFKNNKIIIMPQTVFYEDNEVSKKELLISKEIYCKHKHLYFCLRDKKSYDYVVENSLVLDSSKCFFLPDMALNYKSTLKFEQERRNALVCFRKDREKVLSDKEEQSIREHIWSRGITTYDTTTVYLYGVSLGNREREIESKLKEYGSAKIVVTDRLHSMIFAALSHTPCVALDNVTGKVSGVYEWIKDLDYIKLAKNVDEAIDMIDYLLTREGENQYSFDTKEYFLPLVNLFKGEQ